MALLRIILSAGVCSAALSGCLPAVAGLALSAASLVTGGGSNNGANGFRNPIDQRTAQQQVRQALNQLDDKVDPACQAMLDEHLQTYGTLAFGVGGKPGEKKPAPIAADPAADAKTQKPPVNLLTKVSVPAEEAAPEADVAVSAEKASGTAAAETKPEGATPSAPGNAVAALPAEGASADAPAGPKPVKVSLKTDAASGPGQCEHRWVCLPGTRKPTVMLMCPGKGGKKPDAGANLTADAPAPAEGAAAEKPAKGGQETAALGNEKSDAAAPPAAGAVAAGAPAAKAPPAPEKAAPAPAAEPVRETVESGGVADWNWSHDPSKHL